jgi:hypothetical protein
MDTSSAHKAAVRVHAMFHLPPCPPNDSVLRALALVFEDMKSHLPSPYLYNTWEVYLDAAAEVLDAHDRVAAASTQPAIVRNYSHHMLVECIREYYNASHPSI